MNVLILALIYCSLSKIRRSKTIRFNKINKCKAYFIAEIREKEEITKRISKYIATFDYFNKALTLLSAIFSIASFATIIVAPIGIPSQRFSFAFSITT